MCCTIAPFGFSFSFFPFLMGRALKLLPFPLLTQYWDLGLNPYPSQTVTALHLQVVPFLQNTRAKANTASP